MDITTSKNTAGSSMKTEAKSPLLPARFNRSAKLNFSFMSRITFL